MDLGSKLFQHQLSCQNTCTNFTTKVGVIYESLGDFVYFDRDLDNNTWISNPLFTNGIDLRREIHSLYSQMSGEKGKWQYTVGLRLEYFDREVKIDSPNETFKLDRFNLFPSVNLSYELGEGLMFKTGYRKLIILFIL